MMDSRASLLECILLALLKDIEQKAAIGHIAIVVLDALAELVILIHAGAASIGVAGHSGSSGAGHFCTTLVLVNDSAGTHHRINGSVSDS